MKLYLITTPTSQRLLNPEEITAADHAEINRPAYSALFLKAAVECERKGIPPYILELEQSVLLNFPVQGGVQ